MWWSGETCLHTDCCFSELALKKNPTKHVGLDLEQSGHHNHYLIDMWHVLGMI